MRTKNKYGAKQVTINGITFDSLIEGKFYTILVEKKHLGLILDFELQPKFTLLPAFENHGKKHKAITYTADFKIVHLNGEIEIIDIKGFEPRDFPLRKKMFNYNNPDLHLTILADCPIKWGEFAVESGFIELDLLKRLRASEKRKKSKEAKTNGQAETKEETQQTTTREKTPRTRRDLDKRV